MEALTTPTSDDGRLDDQIHQVQRKSGGTPEGVGQLMDKLQMDMQDIAKAGAKSATFFNKVFFPNTFRSESPLFHHRMLETLNDPRKNLVHFRCFRGSAKTTLARAFLARRTAYNISRTALFVGASAGDAIRSTLWLKGQIERNRLFSQFFGLEPGIKWADGEYQVLCRPTGHRTYIFGQGATGSVRGVNVDDYRPDTIVADDVINDENSLTKESRDKLTDLILGALRRSLISREDEPNAKFLFLNTPLNEEDASAYARKDPLWHCDEFPCWTPETMDLPLQQQVSCWPEYHPTEDLRLEKQGAIDMNKYSIFAREMECQLVTEENAAFKSEWIQTISRSEQIPSGMTVVAVDPVPPPSEVQVAKRKMDSDFEAIVVVTRAKGNYYIREYQTSRGHNPNWTISTALGLALKYGASRIVVETVAYQRVLVFLFQQEMQRKKTYFAIAEFNSRVPKYNRIVSAFSGIGYNKKLYCFDDMYEFLKDFRLYPQLNHDDLLDAASIGLLNIISPSMETDSGTLDLDESEYEELPPVNGAP